MHPLSPRRQSNGRSLREEEEGKGKREEEEQEEEEGKMKQSNERSRRGGPAQFGHCVLMA